MIKKCKRCGKDFSPLFSWNEYCFSCCKELELERQQETIRNPEEGQEIDTFSSDYVICPYCGCALLTDLGYADFPEIYEEGFHTLTCPECDKDFEMETNVSYSWETKRKEE